MIAMRAKQRVQQTIDRGTVERIVRELVFKHAPSGSPKLVVSISARHCHLTDEHVEVLFGKGHKLTPEKPPGS
jgi:propanediol utilization protein